MIILDTVNENVSVVTNKLSQLAVKTGWTDDSTTPTQSVSVVAVSSTEETIIPAPGASVVRAVKMIDIQNTGLSQAAMITINKNISGSPTLLYKTELFPGESLKFSSRRGWYKLDSAGIILELFAEQDFEKIIDDYSNPAYVYTCFGLTGSSFAEPVWAANRFEIATGKKIWAGGTSQMKHIANNRAILTYP